MKSYLYRYDSKISPRPPIFTRGPVRVKSASIEKIFAPCYFSPRKPPRYGFSAGFLKIEILVILVLSIFIETVGLKRYCQYFYFNYFRKKCHVSLEVVCFFEGTYDTTYIHASIIKIAAFRTIIFFEKRSKY